MLLQIANAIIITVINNTDFSDTRLLLTQSLSAMQMLNGEKAVGKRFVVHLPCMDAYTVYPPELAQLYQLLNTTEQGLCMDAYTDFSFLRNSLFQTKINYNWNNYNLQG